LAHFVHCRRSVAELWFMDSIRFSLTGLRSFLLAFILLGCNEAEQPAPTALNEAFSQAASDYSVPRDLLVSIAFTNNRMEHRVGMPAQDGTIGIMSLRPDDRFPSLAVAAEAMNEDRDTLKSDRSANIRGAAALLAGFRDRYEDRTGVDVDTLQEWYPIVASYAGATDPLVSNGFAGEVYDWMFAGFAIETRSGEWIELEPQEMPWRGTAWELTGGSGLVDQFVAASSANYTQSSRTTSDIDMVVIHTTQGSYSGTISWFQNADASASAHYVIRSSDGEITQMVDEEDVAWHGGDWDTNSRSIGIEHEGYVDEADVWYTDAMLRNSAALVRELCDRNGIPMDRNHIIGHSEVPGCASAGGGGSSCHTDPGDGWDWDYFMSLVTTEGGTADILTSNLADGEKSGWFSAVASSSRYGVEDSCSGPVSGSVTGGLLYLTAECVPDTYPDNVGTVPVTISAQVSGATALDGDMFVEGYSDSWLGTIQSDGSADARISGEHNVGGDLGTLAYELKFQIDP
jgi:hypothetical protein